MSDSNNFPYNFTVISEYDSSDYYPQLQVTLSLPTGYYERDTST